VNGNTDQILVIDSIAPTATITGNNGLITFTFSEAINSTSFIESDINVVNGTLVLGSLTQLSGTTFTANVIPDLAEGHTNVSVSLLAGVVEDAAGNGNTLGKNITSLDFLFANTNILPSADITGWDTSHAVSANSTFLSNNTFNQDIGGWNTGYVVSMSSTFNGASSFDQNLGSWDISSLIDASNMFDLSGMSLSNMDATLRGWAKLDTTTGETAIQNSVNWDIANYTDATARQYLIDTYGWTIGNGVLSGGAVAGGNASGDIMDYSATITSQTLHGLGGNDTITGAALRIGL